MRLLTPLCKYFATEICDDLTRDAMQVFGGIGYTMDADVAKLHADSLIMTIYEGTSEIQASFALKEMGKGALAVVFKELRTELAALHADPARGALAKRVEEVMVRIEEAAKALFTDLAYALLRAKLLAEMVIDVIASASCSSRRAWRPSGSGSPKPSSAGGCSTSSTWIGASSRTRRAAWRATSTCSSSSRPAASEAPCGSACSAPARAAGFRSGTAAAAMRCARARAIPPCPRARRPRSRSRRTASAGRCSARAPTCASSSRASRRLHPRPGTRDLPLDVVLLANAELDHVLGLLVLREALSYRILSTPWVRDALLEHNAAFRLLEPVWSGMPLDTPFALDRDGRLEARLFPVPAKLPSSLAGLVPAAAETSRRRARHRSA